MDPGYSGSKSQSRSYALSGRIMLSAVVILFFVIILMVCLHLYARWYLLRARRRYLRRRTRSRRPSAMVFYVDPSSVSATATGGLSESVIKSLPVFTFSSATHPDPIECAVCLSEFEENESGRVLPDCKHSFHVDCIDMWFHSHSTCPLCRSPVETVTGPENNPAEDVAVAIPEHPTSISALCDTCRDGSGEVGSSSTPSSDDRRKKPAAIEVPRRNAVSDSFEGDSTRSDSPASRSFRSPMSRMLSFKRILSRDRRTAVSPSAGTGAAATSPSSVCTASVDEPDIEQGRGETH